jgi:site-specific recombinase XerD
MSDPDISDYDAQRQAIQAYNQPILDAFSTSLKQAGLSAKTVAEHVSNIDFFTHYLVYYDPFKRLDEADGGDVWGFLEDWFPRKAMWASVTSTKSNMASFKKFFRWMGETGRVSAETVADALDILKEYRDEFLASAE